MGAPYSSPPAAHFWAYLLTSPFQFYIFYSFPYPVIFEIEMNYIVVEVKDSKLHSFLREAIIFPIETLGIDAYWFLYQIIINVRTTYQHLFQSVYRKYRSHSPAHSIQIRISGTSIILKSHLNKISLNKLVE